MAHWILQCNPKHWRVRDFFADGHDTTAWTVRRHRNRIAVGDDVALWLSGPDGGVVALGTVLAEPGFGPLAADNAVYWAESHSREEERWTMPVRFDRVFLDAPVGRSVLLDDERFAESQIIRAPRGANPFPVEPAAWAAVVSRVPGHDRAGDPGAEAAPEIPSDTAAPVQTQPPAPAAETSAPTRTAPAAETSAAMGVLPGIDTVPGTDAPAASDTLAASDALVASEDAATSDVLAASEDAATSRDLADAGAVSEVAPGPGSDAAARPAGPPRPRGFFRRLLSNLRPGRRAGDASRGRVRGKA